MLRFDNNITIHNDASNAKAFPWLRRATSNWSLRSSIKTTGLMSSPSTVSLPLSVTSTECSSSPTIEEEESTFISIPDHQGQDDSPPPSYDDPSHPWIFKLPKSLSSRVIIPREEEGHETLPDYECTINKMSYTHVKRELSEPNVRSKNRSWRDLHVVVYGTKISAYHDEPTNTKKGTPPSPVWSYSMQGAQVTVASDYRKYSHVIRLNIHNGPQFLMTTKTDVGKREWMGILESSIHISSDLDVRPMPQFITLISRSRQRRRRQRVAQQTESLV